MVELSIPPEFSHPEFFLLFAPAIVGYLRYKLKKQVEPDPSKWNSLEIHHLTPRYKNGTDDESNLVACSRPDHASYHYQLAQEASSAEDRRANQWAVSAIVTRMTPEELKEWNKKLKEIDKKNRIKR